MRADLTGSSLTGFNVFVIFVYYSTSGKVSVAVLLVKALNVHGCQVDSNFLTREATTSFSASILCLGLVHLDRYNIL